MITVPARPYIVIPATLRRRCGLRAGDHMLLAASPGHDVLASSQAAGQTDARRTGQAASCARPSPVQVADPTAIQGSRRTGMTARA
jgi:bifunctional DNA-binding transcriptional regulator/antitoxin component of YhaV-PrlF toxin-antitoxin module